MTLYCGVEWGGGTRIQYTTKTKGGGGGGLCVCGGGWGVVCVWGGGEGSSQ